MGAAMKGFLAKSWRISGCEELFSWGT